MIFVALDADGVPRASFRRLADGSLTDARDAAVDAAQFARFAVAHLSSLGDEAAQAWRGHLADYAVVPPFDQLTRPLIPLPDLEMRRLDGFAGYVVGARRLAEVATILGYACGRVGHAGALDHYEKRLVDLGFACRISISDAPIGKAADSPVRLQSASLRHHRPDGDHPYHFEGVRLARAPPILVSELWHDFKTMAGAGSGPREEDAR